MVLKGFNFLFSDTIVCISFDDSQMTYNIYSYEKTILTRRIRIFSNHSFTGTGFMGLPGKGWLGRSLELLLYPGGLQQKFVGSNIR